MLLCVNTLLMKYTNAFVCQYYNEVYKCFCVSILLMKYTNAFCVSIQ